MKNLKSKPFALIAFAMIALALSGCGKSNKGGSAGAPLPNTGYGYPGGGYPGSYPGAGSCPALEQPIQLQLPVTVGMSNIVSGGGGYGLPYPGGYPGGVGGMMNASTVVGEQTGKIYSDAHIVMTVPAPVMTYNGVQGSGMASGTIQLKPVRVQAAMERAMASGVSPQALCSTPWTATAMSLGYYSGPNNTAIPYGGSVIIQSQTGMMISLQF